jgi:hypothetical protein
MAGQKWLFWVYLSFGKLCKDMSGQLTDYRSLSDQDKLNKTTTLNDRYFDARHSALAPGQLNIFVGLSNIYSIYSNLSREDETRDTSKAAASEEQARLSRLGFRVGRRV